MSPNDLERCIRDLLRQSVADAELRENLEKLAVLEISFSGFTWLWGPELYRRNRILFRPFILSRFSTWMTLPKWRSEVIHWRGDKARILEAWLAEVDKNDDADLFRRLYEWRLHEQFNWRHQDKRARQIAVDLLARFRAVSTPAQRQIVLRKFDLWFELDEESACALYTVDPVAAGPYILRRLRSGWLGEPKRRLWTGLLRLTDDRKDEDFRWKLYRRQIPLGDWSKECLALCEQIQASEELVQELQKRHPEGWNLNLADGFYKLVISRGRDVFPYVMRHLRQVWGGWFSRGTYGQMADYARKQGWWGLWSALIRTCASAKEFNRVVESFIEGDSASDEELKMRLLALSGTSREWNWGGFGFATVHQLDESVALAMWKRFPDLLRGPYKIHLQSHLWGHTYPKLLRHFIAHHEDEMIDFIASRLVTRCGRWGNARKLVDEADEAADYYNNLKSDETEFSRRAANVLGQVPAYAIFNYNELIKQNRLARLLFERSAAAYLAHPNSLADLVEGAEIHVQALAYRALGLDDQRAREQAARHLPLLLGTLLRPLQRDTRTLAFGALANATHDLASARLVLERAREALELPDTHYPKEKLLGLIARILWRWPELRSPKEQPVVYEKAV